MIKTLLCGVILTNKIFIHSSTSPPMTCELAQLSVSSQVQSYSPVVTCKLQPHEPKPNSANQSKYLSV